MNADIFPRGRGRALTVANVAHKRVFTPDEIDLGGLSQVVATRLQADVILYGEFRVDATTVDGHDPGELRFDEAALCGIVEDWDEKDDGTVTLSAYVYVESPGHGLFDPSLNEAIGALNRIRIQCMRWLHSRPDPQAG